MIQKKWKLFKRKINVKITKRNHVFKGFASSYNIEILNSFNPDLKYWICKLTELLTQLKGFKFVTTLPLVFQKINSEDKTYGTFYSNSEAEIIINESDFDDVFESIYTTIISNIEKSLEKFWGWIIDSVIH